MHASDAQVIEASGVGKEPATSPGLTEDLVPRKIENLGIFSTDDERLKVIGKELADDTGRAIFTIICRKSSMSAADIAKALGISLPLVNWHVNRLLNSGLVKIERLAMSQKNKPVKYYSPSSTIIVIGTELGEPREAGILDDANGSNPLTRRRLAASAIWARLTRSVSAALVSFATASVAVYTFGRMLSGSTLESNGIKLADPDAITGTPQAQPVDSLVSFLYGTVPAPLADAVIALLGGAVVGAAVLIAVTILKPRLRD